ncbi:uncharacterized protein involved in type VI secretion and phage assembly [Flavobacterium sp. 7E]|nr:uncharacterized protein involved in type VI secretion and phage assembly [Flavobacterium sp. 7E]
MDAYDTTALRCWKRILFHALGEEVLVGFEGNNAQNPYVLGSQYNGSESSGYADGENNVKAIHTRSGTKIIMNDSEGSILIEDPSGNTWQMDGQGNISVNAPKNFTLNAGEDVNITAGKNVSVSAGESMTNSANKDITQTAGQDITQTAAGDFTESANNKSEIVENDYNRGAGETADLFSKKFTAHSSEEDMLLKSKTTVQLNSGEKSVNH